MGMRSIGWSVEYLDEDRLAEICTKYWPKLTALLDQAKESLECYAVDVVHDSGEFEDRNGVTFEMVDEFMKLVYEEFENKTGLTIAINYLDDETDSDAPAVHFTVDGLYEETKAYQKFKKKYGIIHTAGVATFG